MSYLIRNKKSKYTIYVFVCCGVLGCWSIPKEISESLQGGFVALYSRVFPKPELSSSQHSVLDVENLLLKEYITTLKQKFLSKEVSQQQPPLFSEILSPYFQNLIEGRVIYRDPAHWASSCWVDVGKDKGVKKNSPVLSGKVLVGLVDYVGEKQSRVRLITDEGMKPSVIAMRGNIQIWWIQQKINELSCLLEWLPHNYILEKDKYEKLSQLRELSESIQAEGDNQESLRGTLSGVGGPLWKQETMVLRGEGFCFEEGKTLCPEDILVTTGLDGVFPPGLPVAKVSKVIPPRDGACAFNIKAEPLESQISTLSHLFILPPMEFNPNDRPDIFGLLWE